MPHLARTGCSGASASGDTEPGRDGGNPHDLDQERILAALGGYLSCLELVDTVAPAFFDWYRAQVREVPRPIRAKQPAGPWRAAKRAACCPARGFDEPQEAAEHARSPGTSPVWPGSPRAFWASWCRT